MDTRYTYHWDLLKAALEATKEKYGAYTLKPSVRMTEDRQVRELRSNSKKLTVMIRETSIEREQELETVRIPIDKNLIGYRVLLINKKDKKTFDSIKTLDQLKKIPMRQGEGWGDIAILEQAGFNVIKEVYYDRIFENLIFSDHTTAFPRGVTEVQDEFAARKNRLPNLAIEDNIMMFYSLPTYFWFPKTEDGKKLAQRTKEGLEKLIDSGEFDKKFNQYYGKVIDQLNLKKRKLFKVNNPFLPTTVPVDNKKLWFDPTK
ncbi:hypothetical protein [Bdellovibrio reynosensis]|uniref:Solute-binding protein family 3/N-terminal domain-containing protein n=1 Tax=Bdellovibrio reynosensis TaxID=2835041 RepID=A0ABY4CCL4_9BACT|nr:hypothetical protein [Bdellovibrio reynosensis]UOF02524.1 hypothetical protein MNR06_06110 [Bdellovibrio reynosensis]